MESPHPQVLKIARNPCGVIGRLLFGSIHWDLPDLSQFIFLSRVSLAENIAILLTPLSERAFGKTYSPIFGSDCRTFVSSRDNGIL